MRVSPRLFSMPSVLLVNHGYPPWYNAGSEVYTQTLANRLNRSRKTSAVSVVAREQDPFRLDFAVRQTADEHDSTIPVYLINHAREAPYQRFVNKDIDRCFQKICEQLNPRPTIVHFGHLNHLSLSLPAIARDLGAKTIYTLHDFWLMCPRGQFLVNGVAKEETYQLCTKQENQKCASKCFVSRFATGNRSDLSEPHERKVFFQDYRPKKIRR